LETAEPQVEPAIDGRIWYLIPVADWKPDQSTPLAGFSLSLCENHQLVRTAGFLPSTIFWPSEEARSTRLARRMSGLDAIEWHPQSPRAIRSEPVPPAAPFQVVLLPDNEDAADYAAWAASGPIRPILVGRNGPDIRMADLNEESLRRQLLRICDELDGKVERHAIIEARQALDGWTTRTSQTLPYSVFGHGSVVPNLMALGVAGWDAPGTETPAPLGEGTSPLVEQMVRTSRTILEIRDGTPASVGSANFARRPSLTLFTPAMYDLTDVRMKPGVGTPTERRAFDTVKQQLARQRGYSFMGTTPAQMRASMGVDPDSLKQGARPTLHWLAQLRQREVALANEAVASLAGSEISAVLRLPFDINRTGGAVRQFVNHFRGKGRSARRCAREFREVQAAIGAAIPTPFQALIAEIPGEIRIVSDAQVGWLDCSGLPLCIRRDLAHVPATPGNLLVGQLTAKPILRLTSEDFSKILVISAIKRDDPIRAMFELAFDTYGQRWKDRIQVDFVEAHNADELVAALNAFEGHMVIFDGHGSHKDGGPGVLHLHDETIDVWTLNGRVAHMPAIVLLSACDTHAADRNHATTASGFLGLGARAVLASVLPLDAMSAAVFAARLVYRIADYLPVAVAAQGRPFTWTEVVGGMIRLQLMSDYLLGFLAAGEITNDQFEVISLAGHEAINQGDDKAFEGAVRGLVAVGVEREVAARRLREAIATSSGISYRNIGRPETILFDSSHRQAALARELETTQLEALGSEGFG